jgi:hypothetical protein
MSKQIKYYFLLVLLSFGLFSCNKNIVNNLIINDSTNTSIVTKTTTSVSGDTTVYTIGKLIVTVTKTSPCAPSTEIFTFKADASNISGAFAYNWYFGDGYSDSGTVVSHGYNNAADFVVLLELKDSSGLVIYSATVPVKAWGQQLKAVAIFSTTNDFPSNLNYVTFNSASSVNHGSIVNYYWNWGDSTTSSVAVALTRHEFPISTKDVNYTVKLTITTDAGCTADTSLTVWVPGAYPITGGFSAVEQNACTNESFLFTAQATNVPTGSVYYWHWSDGTGDDSGYTAQHSFAYMNDYDVTMYIKLNGRTIYTTDKDITAKGPNPAPTASFYFTWVDEYPTNVLVSFTSQSTIQHGAIDGYSWNFGNGQTDNNFDAFTETRYQRGATGTSNQSYQISLIVTGNGCADTAYQTVSIPAQN